MTRFLKVFSATAIVGCLSASLVAVADHPSWAYGFVDRPGAQAPPVPAAPGGAAGAQVAPDTAPHSVPGAARTFTRAEANNPYGPADWFPNEHPVPPPIVATGRRAAEINACGLCHYMGGKGRQENASLAGLPYDYFVRTMLDFKNDRRRSADPRKANTNRMIAFAKAMTDEEIQDSARYYAAIPWTKWVRVVETRMVPKTRMQFGVFIRLPGSETEPLGNRIVEGPEDFERFEIRDPRSGFVAYAPVGSIKKGEILVKTGGNGRTVQCAVCHGPTLDGMGPVPGIAGRSPSYVARQLYDMQTGARNGVWSDLMKPVVANLTADDLVSISAYSASLTPGASAAVR